VWLNCLPSDHSYTKDLIDRLKHRGIQFVTGRPNSTARVAANTSENLAPFFEACRIYHDFFNTPPDSGGADPARWAVFDEKPIINRA
jgi:hypothetical protein